jgi:magnesium transporter
MSSELRANWPQLTQTEQVDAFHQIRHADADRFFSSLGAQEQAQMLQALPGGERRVWLRSLAPDDAADVIQNLDEHERSGFLDLLDGPSRREVAALMAYAEDEAGGLMSPRFARLRPDMTVGEAIRYLRRQAQAKVETIYYAYVLDQEQHLKGVVSFRDLFAAPSTEALDQVMRTEVVSVAEELDQESVARIMTSNSLNAVPVVDSEGRMKGIVTMDDIVDVVQEAATEDIQKLGGMEALDTPYMQTGLLALVKKRGGWLCALFLGEMLTASAMAHYQDEIARAVVLATFVPMIISSGGNSGSQATTLIIRAMALGEVTMQDWWRITRRELLVGLALGLLLATIGFARVLLWQAIFQTYGTHSLEAALTVAVSLVGVVTWGTLAGSMLPLLIQRAGWDPASASAPFVATLVDVSGLVIYFTVAGVLFAGHLV